MFNTIISAVSTVPEPNLLTSSYVVFGEAPCSGKLAPPFIMLNESGDTVAITSVSDIRSNLLPNWPLKPLLPLLPLVSSNSNLI